MMGIVVALVVAGGLQKTVASPSVTGHTKIRRNESCLRSRSGCGGNAYVERFDDYEKMIDEASISLVLKRLG